MGRSSKGGARASRKRRASADKRRATIVETKKSAKQVGQKAQELKSARSLVAASKEYPPHPAQCASAGDHDRSKRGIPARQRRGADPGGAQQGVSSLALAAPSGDEERFTCLRPKADLGT